MNDLNDLSVFPQVTLIEGSIREPGFIIFDVFRRKILE